MNCYPSIRERLYFSEGGRWLQQLRPGALAVNVGPTQVSLATP
jgi:hypothetical protein